MPVQQHRRYLMCPPDYFTVTYQINPWMDPRVPTDTAAARRQWQVLHHTYLALGHEVEVVRPVPGLPDMVYAANGGFTLDGVALTARFSVAQRHPEEQHYQRWFADHGFEVRQTDAVLEGEGDLLVAGEVILAGHGFRTSLTSHAEVAAIFDREVVSLKLIDPRFYHLDTALCVLDPVQGPGGADRANIAWLPSAFDAASRALLRERFPEAIVVSEADGHVLGPNAVSDGLNVVLARRATGFAAALRERGYHPVPVTFSELLRGGGCIKCCTLHLREGRS